MKNKSEKKLERYGVAGIDFESVEKAMAYTYDTTSKTFPSTELIFKENPFNPQIKSAQKILEIGCGVGRNLKWIMDNTDADYYGVDPNDSMLNYFWDVNDSKYKGRTFLHRNFDKLADIKFDVIISTYVFQHITYRPQPPEMNIDDITQELFKLAHTETVFLFVEHDKEEPGWIERWFATNGIIPDVYIKNWTVKGRCSQPHQCDRGGHDLIIFKHLV